MAPHICGSTRHRWGFTRAALIYVLLFLGCRFYPSCSGISIVIIFAQPNCGRDESHYGVVRLALVTFEPQPLLARPSLPPQLKVKSKTKTRARNLPGWGYVPNPEDWKVVDEMADEDDDASASGAGELHRRC